MCVCVLCQTVAAAEPFGWLGGRLDALVCWELRQGYIHEACLGSNRVIPAIKYAHITPTRPWHNLDCSCAFPCEEMFV